MATRLPPLNALKAFEAAGRHLSFSKAAEELHVTPAAVGHQIKQLEDFVGVPLFVRLNRAVQLTESGQTLLPAAVDGFDRLRAGIDAVNRLNQSRPLTVSVVPSFGSKWLLHRLDTFRAEHPEVEVRIDATVRVVDLVTEGIDVAIRYGTGDYPGMRVDCLMDDEIFPVCSPELVKGKNALRKPEDLRHHLLLQTEWNPNYAAWPDWPMWLKAAGLEDLKVNYSPRFSGQVEAMFIDAAIKGKGVALTSKVLVAEDLAAGRLVRPFELSYPLNFCYYLVTLESVADAPKVSAFRQWILREVEAETAG